jgi:hypothetical protein
MNYCTITIKDQTIGLKFGMASFRYLSEGKFQEGKSFVGDGLTEIGVAHILYSGYYNNCIVKDVEPLLTFSDFVDYVEGLLVSNSDSTELNNAIKVWTNNDLIKKSTETDPKKKNLRGKKLKPLP